MENEIQHPLPVGTNIEFKVSNSFKQGTIKGFESCNVGYVYDVMGGMSNDKYKVIQRDVLLVQKTISQEIKEMVNHPSHYGGKDNPMEAIKIIDHYQLPFSLGNTLKYILRADKKANKLEDLKKAAWYLQHEITKLEKV